MLGFHSVKKDSFPELTGTEIIDRLSKLSTSIFDWFFSGSEYQY